MKTVFHTWSLGRTVLDGNLGIDRVPTMVTRAGFTGLEWLDRLLPSYDPNLWQDLADQARRAGAPVLALSLCLELGASAARAAEQIQRAQNTLNLCARIGVRAVRISLGGGGPLTVSRALSVAEGLYPRRMRDQRPLGEMSRRLYRLLLSPPRRKREVAGPRAGEDWRQRAAGLLRPLARQARELGLALGVENHYGPSTHAEDILDLIERTGFGLGVCLDLGNFYADQDALAAARLLAPRVVHVHYKVRRDQHEAEARELGYGDMLAVLGGAGYDGMFSVEYEGPGEGLAGAATGARVLGELWARAIECGIE